MQYDKLANRSFLLLDITASCSALSHKQAVLYVDSKAASTNNAIRSKWEGRRLRAIERPQKNEQQAEVVSRKASDAEYSIFHKKLLSLWDLFRKNIS